MCLPPRAPCDVCSLSVRASARPSAGSKCCARVLSVPGAVGAFASAGKGCRGYQVRLFSAAVVGLNFQTKGRSELYFLQGVLPTLIVLERPSACTYSYGYPQTQCLYISSLQIYPQAI